MIEFKLEKFASQSGARAGKVLTDHGIIQTPIFMPVGTQGAVKYVTAQQLTELGAQVILGNTFHLYLRPGHDLIKSAGGLHNFMKWENPILTDSGGFQVYSLSGIRKITEEGVKFQSPIDGSKHFFSPEVAVDIQKDLGADIIMAFDECTPYPCEYDYAAQSMALTHRWLDRCLFHFNKSSGPNHNQTLSPIVQGSTFKDLRIESAKVIAEKNCEINAIGGLSVGEPSSLMYEMTEIVCDHLPKNKARYLMGVGTPQNLLECIDRGIDMFDCVLPTRNARHGHLYTLQGVINIKNAKWKTDHSPIDNESTSAMSRTYSKAYLRHLFYVNEAFGYTIASVHNLSFYMRLVKEARENIINNTFHSWKKDTLIGLHKRL